MSAFGDLIEAGKVRYVGTSNFAAGMRLKDAIQLGSRGYPRIASEQLRYSLLHRSEFEVDTMPLVLQGNIGVTCFSPLAAGFLTGKYCGGFKPGERSDYVRQFADESGWRLIELLAEIAKKHDTSIAAISLAWLLHQPGITAPVVGASSVEQLQDWLPAARVSLEPSETEELGRLGWRESMPEHRSW